VRKKGSDALANLAAVKGRDWGQYSEETEIAKN